MFLGPKIITDGLVLHLDAANPKSFRGEATTNTINFLSVGASRYNNPSFSGTITNTGQTFRDSPIWEATFIPQDSSMIPRLGSTEGFGFFHSMGIPLQADTDYMASVYFKTEYPLVNTSTQGFINTYSNITGWGQNGTANTRYQESGWTRLYSKYRNSVNIGGTNYSIRGNSNILSATVNTTQTTQVLVTITLQSNGTFQTTTDYGTNTLGGGLTDYNTMVGIYFADPTITSTGGISGMSIGTSNILQHGLNTSTWTKLSSTNTILKSSFPTNYFILLNVPSTGGINATIQFRPNLTGYYTALNDNKFWKITFDVTNLNVNDVIRTYWTAPMIEQHSRNLPSNFVIGTRGTTLATGGGLLDRSGNNNSGELINGVTYNVDNKGNLIFDGIDDYLIISNQGNLVFGNGDFSINIWIKFPISSTGEGGAWGPIISKGCNTSAPAGTWWIAQNSTNNNRVTLNISSTTGGTFVCGVTTTTFSNGWHNVCAVRSGTTALIYSDGIFTSNDTTSDSNLSSTRDLTICATATPTISTQRTNASIGIVQLYTRSLTPSEILQNYNATKSRFGL